MINVDIRKRLGDFDLALAFDSDAKVTALFGPSGAGKTSVLDMIAGLSRPDAGRIVVDGAPLFDPAAGIDVPPDHRRVGYVFQDKRLFPHLRVRANLLYGAPDDAGLAETARDLGIAHLLDRWPRHLSGGEAQRVAIGRALLMRPRLLLLDEPLAHLDRARRAEVLRLIERLRDTGGVPLVYVTHDANDIERLGAMRVDL